MVGKRVVMWPSRLFWGQLALSLLLGRAFILPGSVTHPRSKLLRLRGSSGSSPPEVDVEREISSAEAATRAGLDPRPAGQAFERPEDMGKAIASALMKKFAFDDIDRVLDSWNNVRKGVEFKKDWGEKGVQDSSSYIAGLSALPWHDNEAHAWTAGLEENWRIIADELKENTERGDLGERGVNVWASAVEEEAMAYGPNWRTLVLQDRKWQETNVKLFPKTTQLLKDLKVPSCEAFFARQAPRTGIKVHTDNTNFILTAHLGLDIPEGDCSMTVGNERRKWGNGKVCIFDTSFLHGTDNNTDEERTVLLLRFWHPDLTKVEREALQFAFDALEDHHVLDMPQTKLEGGESKDGALLDDFLDKINKDSNLPYSTTDETQNMTRAERRKYKKLAKKTEEEKAGPNPGFGPSRGGFGR